MESNWRRSLFLAKMLSERQMRVVVERTVSIWRMVYGLNTEGGGGREGGFDTEGNS